MSVTRTRADLATAVRVSVPILSGTKAASLVDQVLEEVTATLARGEDVKLSGFGTFRIRAKGERVGRNPKTGVAAVVAPRRVVTFNASETLRAAVNNEPSI